MNTSDDRSKMDGRYLLNPTSQLSTQPCLPTSTAVFKCDACSFTYSNTSNKSIKANVLMTAICTMLILSLAKAFVVTCNYYTLVAGRMLAQVAV